MILKTNNTIFRLSALKYIGRKSQTFKGIDYCTQKIIFSLQMLLRLYLILIILIKQYLMYNFIVFDSIIYCGSTGKLDFFSLL